MNKGFTLVEILVVIAITAIVGTILVAIFANTLRGSNKAQILSNIKQNGQAVLENMDKTVRGADNVVCTSADGTTLTVVRNGLYTRYKFFPSSADANGYIQQDNPVLPETGTSSVCTDPIGTDAPAVNTLTDTGTRTGVSVDCVLSGCAARPVFSRNSSEGYKDQIIIQFNLKPGTGVPQAISDQIDPVTFKTTIGLR